MRQESHERKNAKRLLHTTNSKANRLRDPRSLHMHTEKRSERATPKNFLFFVCPLRFRLFVLKGKASEHAENDPSSDDDNEPRPQSQLRPPRAERLLSDGGGI